MSLSSYFIVVLIVSIVTWCILVIKRHASIPNSIVKQTILMRIVVYSTLTGCLLRFKDG
jgi:hypothetical protein